MNSLFLQAVGADLPYHMPLHDCLGLYRHLPRLADYLWVAEDGMKMNGYNGSQLWDTAFAVQAIGAAGLGAEFSDCMRRAHAYIDATQVLWQCRRVLSPAAIAGLDSK